MMCSRIILVVLFLQVIAACVPNPRRNQTVLRAKRSDNEQKNVANKKHRCEELWIIEVSDNRHKKTTSTSTTTTTSKREITTEESAPIIPTEEIVEVTEIPEEITDNVKETITEENVPPTPEDLILITDEPVIEPENTETTTSNEFTTAIEKRNKFIVVTASTNVTTDVQGETTTESIQPKCFDQYSKCYKIKYLCYDRDYNKIMKTSCAVTCNRCEEFIKLSEVERCADTYPEQCSIWVDNGFCHTYFYTMPEKLEMCMKTCGMC